LFLDGFGVIGQLFGYKRRINMRQFDSGATRDTDAGKPDYEGFLSPLVIERFGKYMDKHRHQADGKVRDSDNWQKGIPQDAYMKSAFRHFVDWWKEHRRINTKDGIEEALCALMFNVMGYLHEYLKEKNLQEVEPKNNKRQEEIERIAFERPEIEMGDK
jgi:hypothetical protein